MLSPHPEAPAQRAWKDGSESTGAPCFEARLRRAPQHEGVDIGSETEEAAMANRRRGEIALQLGGRTYTLCLTLGALAEFEEAFGAPSLTALAERFAAASLSSRDLLKLLAVALRGGGHDVSDAEVAALPLDE